jgi:hypothetical protein
MLSDPRQPIRPQLRPQRSLDNRIPTSTQAQMEMSSSGHTVDQQGNIYAINNNVNTQGMSQSILGGMDNQGMSSQQGINSVSSIGVSVSSHQSSTMGVAHTQPQQTQQQNQQQSAFSSRMAGPGSQQQLDMMHQLNQQPQQQVISDIYSILSGAKRRCLTGYCNVALCSNLVRTCPRDKV